MFNAKGRQPVSFDGLGDKRMNEVKKIKYKKLAIWEEHFYNTSISISGLIKKDMGRGPGLDIEEASISF